MIIQIVLSAIQATAALIHIAEKWKSVRQAVNSSGEDDGTKPNKQENDSPVREEQ